VTTTRPAGRWALCRARRGADALRMYCLPHSGGSPGEYMRWADRLPGAEVWGVQLPGRGSRLSEAPYTRMDELVGALADSLDLGRPYVLFGHSLGSLVAYECAHALRERGLPGPQALIVSGTAAPHVLRPVPSPAGLDDPALVATVERTYGPVPDEVREDEELRDLLLGGLRADLEIVSGYVHRSRPALSVPVTVLGGTGDEESYDELAAWQDHTTAPCTVRMFPGGHFYFRESPDAFFAALTAALAQSAPRDLPGPGAVAAAAPLP
jgi:surfactin synthase thioesterase subunit